MALSRDALYARADSEHSRNLNLSGDAGDWDHPDEAARDWKKIVLVIGLGALSWVATYVGMLELIQANMGDLPLAHKVIIGFSVAMLMTMIIWLLDQIFSPMMSGVKFFYVLGYLFLTAISVGFGFGFYWKVLESRSESTRSAESAISQVQNALHAGSTRLEQLNTTLVQLTKISSAKAIEEREKGTSCPNSRPGDGPRRKLRDADAGRFNFAAQFVGQRISAVKSDLSALNGDLKKVASGDKSTFDAKSGTRNKFMRSLDRRLELTVTGFNTFRSDPQLRQIRADLAQRAEKTIFANGRGGTFTCPDPQLQTALRGVVRAIDQLPELQKPVIAAVEGPEATIEAFRRLSASAMGLLTLEPPPTADELRKLQKKAMQSVLHENSGSIQSVPTVSAGLSKRDYVPLAIAIFVDLCLLLVSMGRPMNRLHSLVPKMREAERGPVIRILSRFNEIHRDPEIRQNFEVFRHVVFDYLGDYYVAVPLDTPYNRMGRNGYSNSYGAADAQELQHEAHLLSNLFTSFEREKIFKRVFFLRTKMIRSRLARQGSKFAGSRAFRVYRFRNGSWSDIILGAVMGAARRVEAEKRRLQALEERMAAARGPQLGEAGRSAKAPPFMTDEAARRSKTSGGLSLTPDKQDETGGNGVSSLATQARMNGSWFKNGSAQHGGQAFAGMHVNGHAFKKNGNGSAVNGGRSSFFDAFDEDDGDDDLEDLWDTTMSEEQVRSQYGKYAESVLAEMNEEKIQKPVNGQSHESENDADEDDPEQTVTQTASEEPVKDVPENEDLESNTGNTDAVAHDDGAVVSTEEYKPQEEISSPKIIALPSVQTSSRVPEEAQPHKLEPASSVMLEADSEDQPVEAKATLVRETATFSVPVSEAALPMGFSQARQGVVLDGAHVQKTIVVDEDVDAAKSGEPVQKLGAPKLIEMLSQAIAQAPPTQRADEKADVANLEPPKPVKND